MAFDKSLLPEMTLADKPLVCDGEPMHPALAPARTKGLGCLFCPVLLTVRGVKIGQDYKGGKFEGEKSAQTHRMKGTGPADAKLMIVLENPSYSDDKEGTAFSGKGYSWIRTALKNAGIDWREVRITYAVRCACGKPSETAIKACGGYLYNEITRVNPSVIIPVGAVALKAVCGPEMRILSSANSPFTRQVCGEDRVIVPVYSIGYIRYNDTEVDDWNAAFKSAAKILDGTKAVLAGRGEYQEVRSAYVAASILDAITDGDVSVDLETSTLDPRERKVKVFKLIEAAGRPMVVEDTNKFRSARIAMVAWTTEVGKGHYVLRHHREGDWKKHDRKVFDAAFKRLLVRKSVRKIFWNAAFEQTWFLVKYGVLAVNFIDAMLVHHQYDENAGRSSADENSKGGHGLDEAAQRHTGMGSWTDKIKPYLKALEYNMSLIPKRVLGPYAGCDVDAALRINRKLLKKLDPARHRLATVFYPRLINEIARMQALGACGDPVAGRMFEKYTRLNMNISETELLALSVVRRYRRRKRRQDPNRGKSTEWALNFGSSNQLREILFTELGYEPFALTKPKSGAKPQASTNKESLNYFVKSKKCKFSIALLKWRMYEKQHGTYAVTLMDQMKRFVGFIRGTLKCHGTKTGRLAASKPNLQNQPDVAKRDYISRFGDEGCLVSIDYSQIEVRVAACLSRDPVLLGVYRRGEDVHAATAMRMFKLSPERVAWLKKNDEKKWKKYRTIAKRIVFGVIYGSGPSAIVRTCRKEGIEITKEEAREYIDKFFRVYRRLKRWLDRIVRRLHRDGVVVSPFGRVRHLPAVWGQVHDEKGRERVARAERQGPNAIIQGSASDFTTSSIILIGRALRREGFKSKIVITVHDSIVLDCLRSEAERVVRLAKDIMENLPKRAASIWGKDFDWSWIRCPIVAEAEIGFNWLHTIKYDPSGKNPEAETNINMVFKKAQAAQDEADAKMRKDIKELERSVAA